MRREKELMPDANPPPILRTADKMEWQFLQTISNYAKLKKFRLLNLLKSNGAKEKYWRVRYVCQRNHKNNCKFVLLALKTTKQGYHVYKHSKHEHNHPYKTWNSSK
jgi:hypothetical protein